MDRDDKIVSFVELAHSIKSMCELMYNDRTTWNIKIKNGKKKNLVSFVVEYYTGGWKFDFDSALRDHLNQKSNGYSSIKVSLDVDSNILYISSKFPAIFTTKSNIYGKTYDIPSMPTGVFEEYKKISLLPKEVNIHRSYSSVRNTRFFYYHHFKFSKKNLERVAQLFSVFIEYHTEKLKVIS